MRTSIRSSPQGPRRPLRLALIALLLAGLAGWQGWHCANGEMAAPLAGIHHLHIAHDPDSADASGYPSGSPDDSMLLGVCLSVLAAIAAALILLASPRRFAMLLRALRTVRAAVNAWSADRTPTLTQLCVSRT